MSNCHMILLEKEYACIDIRNNICQIISIYLLGVKQGAIFI